MKRLLCIVGSMNAGGAETFLMKIYRIIDKTKYQMDFAVGMSERGVYEDEIERLGGKVYRIVPKSQGIIKNYNSIRELVNRENYKYVMRISQHSLSALELLAAKQGGASVRAFRSSNSNTTTGSRKDLLLHRLCQFMPKQFANVRIAPSTEAAEFMFGKGCIEKKKAAILCNGLDLGLYKYDSNSRCQIREELGLHDCFVIGHVGRFNQQKNHNFLLEVFKKIKNDEPKAKLVLVGIGELKDSVIKRAKELGLDKDIIFTGLRNDVPKLLSAFDMFLFPSLYEGMPNTVIEAQACGLQCIISDTITKEAKLTENVIFLPINDGPDKWVEAVRNLREIRNYDRNSIGQTLVDKGYDINLVAKEFVSLIFHDN